MPLPAAVRKPECPAGRAHEMKNRTGDTSLKAAEISGPVLWLSGLTVCFDEVAAECLDLREHFLRPLRFPVAQVD